jgi:hypothetical protein
MCLTTGEGSMADTWVQCEGDELFMTNRGGAPPAERERARRNSKGQAQHRIRVDDTQQTLEEDGGFMPIAQPCTISITF